MTRDKIKAIALARGFTERQQADGSMDINGYVYAFAEAMYAEGQRAMQERAAKLLGDSAENCRKSPMPHYGIPIIFEKAKDEVLALDVKP